MVPEEGAAGRVDCGDRAFVRAGNVLLSVGVGRAPGLESGRGAEVLPDSLTGRCAGFCLTSLRESFPASAVLCTCESLVVCLISAIATPLSAHARGNDQILEQMEREQEISGRARK